MEDTVQFMDTVSIKPQTSSMDLDLNVYHSTNPKPSGEDLEASAYKSNRINVVTVGEARFRFFHTTKYPPRLRGLRTVQRISPTTLLLSSWSRTVPRLLL